MEAEKANLLSRDADWAALAAELRDVETILSYWTEDAVVIPPEQPAVVGMAALREYVEGCRHVPGFSITWKSSDAVLSPDGRLAYMFSDNLVTMDGPDGSPVSVPGRAVTIWRKDADGEWRCAVDIWNADAGGAGRP